MFCVVDMKSFKSLIVLNGIFSLVLFFFKKTIKMAEAKARKIPETKVVVCGVCSLVSY